MIDKFKYYKVRMPFLILTLLFSSERCLHKDKLTTSGISAISVIISWDLVKTEDGTFINLKDTFSVMQKNDLFMYVIPNSYEKSYITLDKNDSIIDERVVEAGKHYTYFIFKAEENTGIRYDSIKTSEGARFLIDSLLYTKTFFRSGINLDSNYKLVNQIRVTRFSNKEVYNVINKEDETDPDSVYLFYSSSFDKVPYTFSSKLDSLHNKKLFKLQIIYNPSAGKKYPFSMPRREMLFEIKEISIPDKESINNLFLRFKRANRKDG